MITIKNDDRGFFVVSDNALLKQLPSAQSKNEVVDLILSRLGTIRPHRIDAPAELDVHWVREFIANARNGLKTDHVGILLESLNKVCVFRLERDMRDELIECHFEIIDYLGSIDQLIRCRMSVTKRHTNRKSHMEAILDFQSYD